MHTIVGLGNKGEKYVHTRHNVGRRVLSSWVEKQHGSFVLSAKYQGLIWKGVVGKCEVLALLPETYMNESGGSVKKSVTSKKKAEELVVLYDDIDLPLGTIRISFNRGSGGHNGIKSIVDALKTEAFIRIRIGVSPVSRGVTRKPATGEGVLTWVMGEFTKKEVLALEAVSERVGEALAHIITHGRESAMNVFNREV